MDLTQKCSLLAMGLMLSTLVVCEPANAERRRVFGANGQAGRFVQRGQYGQRAGARAVRYGQGAASIKGGSWRGPNGGAFKRGCVNAINHKGAFHASGSSGTTAAGGNYKRAGATGVKWGEGAAHASGFSGTTANGSTLDRGSKWGYKKGVGGQSQKGFNYQGANGSAASGYKTNQYDAVSGTGSMTKGRDITAKDGSTYGYDKTTDYTKGQGFTTTVDRQNGQDYTVQYQKGQKPVYTPVID